ncbi:uncharacterized protein LOC111611214 [Xiphophorus maculatus]|uniref:uncharacterized protein LOC111611214 n=1 Tax=Xiphophorus maculatus TaxID=8083 RepID=UPI000C6CD210|nr:uncharacterized protein LOC111611214 [Xiphophorus maculatus]
MWRIVPLLSVLIGALCPAAQGRPPLDVNDTQQQYQADEHSNVTLTVLCPVNSSSDWLNIDLMIVEPLRSIYLYDSRFQPDPHTDDQFKGRLQCDPQLRNGMVECLLSDLRLSDAGRYQWIVATKGRSNLTKLELVVRAVMSQTQEEPSKPTERERIGLYMAVGLLAVIIVCLYLGNIITFCNFTRLIPVEISCLRDNLSQKN